MRIDGVTVGLGDAIVRRVADEVAALLVVTDRGESLMTVAEAAEYLRCKKKRIYDLCSQGRLPFEKEGSRTLIRRRSIDAYLRETD